MGRKPIVIAAIVLGSLIAVAAAASLLVDVDAFRPQLERAMTAAVGRRVAIGHMSLSIFSGSAVADNISIADDPAFGATAFLTARSLRVGVALLPLVFSKHLNVESLVLQQPQLTLRQSAAGTWNFNTLGRSASTSPSASASGLVLSIDRLAIAGGRVVVEAPHAEPRAYDQVTVEVRNVSATTKFPFSFSAAAPGGGTARLTGTAGPLHPDGIGSTPLDATVDATRIDVGRSGVAGSGLAGLIDVHARVESDGQKLTSSGTLHGDKLQLVAGGTPATSPVDIGYALDFDLSTHDGTLTKGDVRIGKAAAELRGRFSMRAATPAVRLTLAGHQMPVSDLQGMLPAMGATLPRGARFQSGVLDADLAAAGPVDRLVITGPLTMSSATLSGFDLGSHMEKIVSLAGLQKRTDTNIETLGVTLRIAPEGIRADGLTCVVRSLGSLAGDGTIAPSGALDFRMLVKLGHTGGMAGEVARVASLGNAAHGVPFRVQGTTTAPVFVPDVGRAAEEAIRNPATAEKVSGFVRSLFGKKKD